MKRRARGIKSISQTGLSDLVDTGRSLLSTVRYRALMWTLAIALATMATIAMTSLSWVPIVGVALTATIVSVNKVAAKLAKPLCWHCGADLSGREAGPYGIVCPRCGSLRAEAMKDAASAAPSGMGHETDDESETPTNA